MTPAGLYVSIPFCKAKCSFCNFASGVFAAERMDGYIYQLCAEIVDVGAWCEGLAIPAPRLVDSIYLGGGTPSLLPPSSIHRLFGQMRAQFEVLPGAEITVECAPGQLSPESLEAFQAAGVNRLSFGVQSFVDRECAAVGRLHSGAACRDELRRVAEAGLKCLGVDLICGLPHQTEASWRYSVEQAIESGVEHVSVYMLEVDEDSRLGREALAGGVRYGAGFLPSDDRVADWFAMACEWLGSTGVAQYEISNFARAGGQSRHNRKYWERADYLGFGMDAHSMLRCGAEGVRWSNGDEMESWNSTRTTDRVDRTTAFEESLFLGLRLVEGVDLSALRADFCDLVESLDLSELSEAGLVTFSGERLRLTSHGRMLSNEVFERLLLDRNVEAKVNAGV